MALLNNLSYWFAGNGRERTCTFNEGTGTVTSPAQGSFINFDEDLKDIGELVYSGGGYEVRVNGAYPYFVVSGSGGGPEPDDVVTIDAVNVTVPDTGSGATVEIIASTDPNPAAIDGVQYRVQSNSNLLDTGWLWTNVISGLPPDSYTAMVRFASNAHENDDHQFSLLPNLSATATKTDESTAAANDGSFTVHVNSGSGEYEITWYDASVTPLVGGHPISSTKNGLDAGTYTATVKDLNTDEEVELSVNITQPAPAPEVLNGTYLEVPLLNSIKFIVNPIIPDGISTFQGINNVLLVNQRFPGFRQTNYSQPFCKVDQPIVQFNSDFGIHSVELKDYKTDETVAAYPVVLKQQNIGKVTDFDIRIESHTEPGQSRVYFLTGSIPIPLSINEAFQIINNVDGFNGGYSIQEIITDNILTGVQYLVINLPYDAPGTTSNAVGRFTNESTNFNVYESVLQFLAISNGLYYVKILASNEGSGIQFQAISEPIRLAVSHPNTNLVEWINKDNDYGDITWTTGYKGMARIESLFTHNQSGGGEGTVSRDSNYALVKVAAKKTQVVPFETYSLPPWLHFKLSVAFDCDIVSVNKVSVQSQPNAYAKPQYQTQFLLANSNIDLEIQGVFRMYNSDDLGSIAEGGFIINEEGGYIKR
jgi:hypothetical protein